MTVIVSELPEDVLLVLIEYLDLQSIFRFARTCRKINRIFSTATAYLTVVRAAAKDIPFPDPLFLNAPLSVPLLRDRLIKCHRFHNAWQTTSDHISTSIIRKLDIPEKVCMIRILPGGQYVVVIDFRENAQFYEVATGDIVGWKSFSKISEPEVIYSIDFTAFSRTTVVWGLLTSDNTVRTTDSEAQTKLCIRAILIHLPEVGQTDRGLRFEEVLVHPTSGTPEMLSISGSYIASYAYHSDDTPDLTVWNWEKGLHAKHAVPWKVNTSAEYVGHPSLHATPNAVFLIGGQLGFHRLHPDIKHTDDWVYKNAVTVTSTQEDADTLSYSSQGRCSKPWWGVKDRPWHRLVSSPSRTDSTDDARTLKVISFEVPSHPDDTEAIRSYMDLGRHRIVPGQESSPQLYHISRFGSKAIWLCQGDNITIQSVALPNLEKQMGGELPGTVKPIDLGSEVNMNRLRAFDMDETAPLFAVAEDEVLWLAEIGSDE